MKSEGQREPSLGIVPHHLWVENRANDIVQAMDRYSRGKYIIPVEWVEELIGHLKTLDKSRVKRKIN